MTNALSTAREMAHSLLAVIAAVAGAQGVLLSIVASFGVHISALSASQGIAVAGGAALAISKAIDSINNAIVSHGASVAAGYANAYQPGGAGSGAIAPPA
jgi:hypothetical protein